MKQIFALWLSILMVLSSATLVLNTAQDAGGSIVPGDGPDYIPSTPIRIDSNAEFPAIASTGNGSEADPWIIEGWDINGTGYGYCIYIGNTTEHFVVRDCYLHDTDGWSNPPYFFHQLTLINVTNGMVFNNYVTENNYGGIYLNNSCNNTISHNTVSFCDSGIGLYWQSNNNSIANNTVYENWCGIWVDTSFNNTVSMNLFYSDTVLGDGINLFSSNWNTMYANTFLHVPDPAYDGGTNYWNISYPTGGNYWSDFDEESEGAYDDYDGVNQDGAGGADGIVDLGSPTGGLNPYTGIFPNPTPTPDYYPLISPTVELANATPTPPDGAVDIGIMTQYLIQFSKAMNTSFFPTIEPSTSPDGAWAWDSTGQWCNFTYTGSDDMPVLWNQPTTYWVNCTDMLDADFMPLSGDTPFNFTIDMETPVVYDLGASPLVNVSVNNPMDIHAMINDTGDLMMTGAFFMRPIGGNDTLDNYTWLDQFMGGNLAPTADPNITELDIRWNATAGYGPDTDAGYLTDGADQDYLMMWGWYNGTGDWKMGTEVYFTNATYDKEPAELQFLTDGTPMGLWINGSGQKEWLDPWQFDYSMTITPRVEVVPFYKNGTLAIPPATTIYTEHGNTYDLPDVYFQREHVVPSGTYPWFVLAADGAMNMGLNMSETNVSVDNDPPTITSIPADQATSISTEPGSYIIHFSEPMDNSSASLDTNLPNCTWSGSQDLMWLNGTYNTTLEGGKLYYVDLHNAYDFAKNPFSDSERLRNFTTGVPWATVTGPASAGTSNVTPTITYDYDNNPYDVIIYYTTDGGGNWTAWMWDDTVDGVMVPDSGIWEGTIHWSARATGSIDLPEEAVPSSPADIESGPYIVDITSPQISNSIPENWDNMVNRSAWPYVIEFDEEMDTSVGAIESNLPDVDWVWDDTAFWLNGTYGDLAPETDYFVNLTGFKDLVGNNLTGQTERQFHTDLGPWAESGGSTSEGTANASPWVIYSASYATDSVEIYYTNDNGTTWTLWGEDTDVNRTWVPDTPLTEPGTYNWNARAMGYINEPVPDGPEDVESGDYVLLEIVDAPSIVSSTPADEETSVNLNADEFVVHFDKEMETSGTPDSNLPNVTWSWSGDGMSLSGSYDALAQSTEYYVNLSGIQSNVGLALSGDTYLTFMTRSADEPGTGTIEGQVTDEEGEPISGATVTVPGTDITTTTNETGWYVLEDVPEGDHTIEISHPDYETQEVDVTVTEGGTETPDAEQLPPPEDEAGGMDWTWIIIILVIVIVGAVAAVLFMRNKGGEPPASPGEGPQSSEEGPVEEYPAGEQASEEKPLPPPPED